MSDRPNIFDYATSELSQDAFFAWLLKWAEDDYANQNRHLHECALKLLRAFFKDYYDKYNDDPAVGKIEDINNFTSVEKIKSVDVERQKKRIDLLLTIETTNNEIFYLIIEDKKMSKINGRKKNGSKDDGNQLKHYRKLWIDENTANVRRTCFIYLKTYSMEKNEKDMVDEAKYSLFDLNRIYKILSTCKSHSEIFRSFLLKLEAVYRFTKFIDCNPFGGFKRSDYKHSVWGYNCYYFYWKKTFKHYRKDYYLALDVWLDEGENECERNLYFCLHIISNLNGDWVEKSEIKIDKTSGIKRIDPENNSYELKRGYVYDYYEKKVPVEGENESDLQSKLNEGMKSEIENLFSNLLISL